MRTIFFDMDGTIADLYGVTNWLEYLMEENTLPYEIAKPLLRLSSLAKILNRLQREGYKIGIISWLSKNGTDEYNKKVTAAKEKWLRTHLKSVQFDEIHIIKYGTNKDIFRHTDKDLIFDDEEKNRKNWGGQAHDVNNIIEVLKGIQIRFLLKFLK